jgi:hypothetical protein
MLLPRFSLRWVLAIIAAFALVFLIVSQGVQGTQWAAAVSVGLAGLALVALIHASTFAVVWVLSTLGTAVSGTDPAEKSPFRPETLEQALAGGRKDGQPPGSPFLS